MHQDTHIDNEYRPKHEFSESMRDQLDHALDDWSKRFFTQERAELFWGSAFTVLQKQAQEHTGRFIFSSVGTVLRKLTLFLLVGGLIYALGGWTALAGFFKFLFNNGGN